MGRYDELDEGGLPGLGIAVIVALFQIAGMLADAIDLLKMLVRN